MKKLIFLFTMVLAVSMAMAQTNNTSEVSQAGVKHVATVDQKGLGDNTSYVNQSNTKNIATISQINPVFDGSLDEDDNLSTVLQSGAKNNAVVSQKNDHGMGNHAGPGGLLEAVINQSGDNNDAEQIQGGANQMGKSLASILQSGNRNEAFQHQLKYHNNAYIDQSGNGNKAMQAQDTDLPEDGSSNFASINQSGNNNYSEQQQQGWSNRMVASQSGNNNNASQIQENYSWLSKATVVQAGNYNEAEQTLIGNLNDALIEQHADGGTAIQNQISGNARPVGYPAINEAKIYQLGGRNNNAFQNQYNEDGNVSNFALIWQDGSNNLATQDQWGGFNSSNIYQTGNGHMATVIQNQVLVP